MSESKHTPWEIIIADDDRMFISEGGDIVCHTDPNHSFDDVADVRRFRLIAAAPDLLEAAIRVRARCQSMRFDPDADAALSDLVAAINKAKGRS